ncbi:MAG TPA: hypothetical protein VMU28_06430 [Terriglobales bacterium]|nr:hypothetical protein [Terriglobales bacterium]HVO63762.1 hypothetical protein [Terriglobales bacterium]
MSVFLVLSSLGVVFYMMVLVALYRDGRQRRRNGSEVCRLLNSDRDAGRMPAVWRARIGGNLTSKTSTEVFCMPVTTIRWLPVQDAAKRERTVTPIPVAPHHVNTQLKRG